MESRWGCNSCAELCEIVKDKKYLFIVIIILFLISSGGAGFALYSLIGGDAKLSENNTNLRIEVILALCGAFLMFMFLIIAMYTLVMDFLVKYERLITRVGQGHISPNQIYPEDPSQLQIEDIE